MKKLALICFVFSVFFSCQESEHMPKVSKNQLVDYQSFSKELGNILDQVSSNMRKRNVRIMDSHQFRKEIKNVMTVVDDNFEKTFDESYHYASTLADSKRGKVEKETIYVTPYQYQVFKQIDELWYLSTNPDIYRDRLERLLEEVVASEAKVEEKNPLLIHLSSQLVAHGFIESNLDLLELTNKQARGSDWWKDWGRCAAGIVGGAGIAALGGCAVGAQVGLGIASIPGCGVGAIMGGIFGGLSGAAAACGNSGGGSKCPSCYHKMEPCEEQQTCSDEGE